MSERQEHEFKLKPLDALVWSMQENELWITFGDGLEVQLTRQPSHPDVLEIRSWIDEVPVGLMRAYKEDMS